MNIKLIYLYHDWANYKNYGEVIFINREGISLAQAESCIRPKLLDDTWFYASRWGLKDLHFERWDDEIDHAFHEFARVEYTDEPATESQTLKEYLDRLPDFKP